MRCPIQARGTVLSPPPTVIVRHPKEDPRKCSVIPLQGRPDLQFCTYPVHQPLPLEGYIRLAAEGPPLSSADRDLGILLLDGNWRAADRMVRHFEAVPPRSLTGWQTAYPRSSNLGTDPKNGLATLEALFIAYHLLGRPTDGLLDHYRWAEHFLALNHL